MPVDVDQRAARHDSTPDACVSYHYTLHASTLITLHRMLVCHDYYTAHVCVPWLLATHHHYYTPTSKCLYHHYYTRTCKGGKYLAIEEGPSPSSFLDEMPELKEAVTSVRSSAFVRRRPLDKACTYLFHVLERPRRENTCITPHA